MNVDATVIIATYNREKDLVRSICSVLAQKHSSFELIVVDQTIQHKAETREFLESIQDNRFSYFLVGPPSLPAARNFGISKAKGDIIIFIDDDVELDDGFIEQHIQAYKDPKVGGVAGRVREKGVETGDVLFHITPTGWHKGTYNYTKDTQATGARGCNMSFRKKALEEVGCFDTCYIKNAYREDSDISYRVRAAGYTLLFKAKASLFHYGVPTGGCRTDAGLFKDVAAFKNDFRFFYKNMNDSLTHKLGFYLMHLIYVVPHPNPKVAVRRLYYLIRGSKAARKELRENTTPIVQQTI